MSTEQNVITAAEVETARAKRKSLIKTFADRLGLDPEKMMVTLKATAFRQKDGYEVTNEQMAALLVVANEHNLNPFTKEIYAYPDKSGGIVPVVGVDGWLRIANENKAYNGVTFASSENLVTLDDAKPCPDWMEVSVYRKDREHPIIHREYLDEVYRPPFVKNDGRKVYGPWQTHTKRMLRWKTMIQGFRQAFSFSGIYDEDEAVRILEADDAIDVTPREEQEQDTNFGPAKVGAVRMRKIVEGLTAAVEKQDASMLAEYEALTNGEKELVWKQLRSWERSGVKKLQEAAKALPQGDDLDAWALEAIRAAKDQEALSTSWRLLEDAYAERDLQVPDSVATACDTRRGELGA